MKMDRTLIVVGEGAAELVFRREEYRQSDGSVELDRLPDMVFVRHGGGGEPEFIAHTADGEHVLQDGDVLVGRHTARFCPECGEEKFLAHQRVYIEIYVDGHGDFWENTHEKLEESIYESETPYGPFTCTGCQKEFDSLDEFSKKMDVEALDGLVHEAASRVAAEVNNQGRRAQIEYLTGKCRMSIEEIRDALELAGKDQELKSII
jgi:hypothetical protein